MIHGCMVSCGAWFCGRPVSGVLWCMVLWQASKTNSDSVDAAGVSVSRARNALNKLRLVMKAYTRAIT